MITVLRNESWTFSACRSIIEQSIPTLPFSECCEPTDKSRELWSKEMNWILSSEGAHLSLEEILWEDCLQVLYIDGGQNGDMWARWGVPGENLNVFMVSLVTGNPCFLFLLCPGQCQKLRPPSLPSISPHSCLCPHWIVLQLFPFSCRCAEGRLCL